MTVGEELNSVDVGLMAGKCLNSLACSDVPELSEGIASTRYESVLVCRVQANAHYVAQMVGKLHNFGARLDIPFHAGHITGRGENAPVINESTAREVTGVARQLASDAGGGVSVLVQVVNGANVVKTTARNVVATRRIGAGHDP